VTRGTFNSGAGASGLREDNKDDDTERDDEEEKQPQLIPGARREQRSQHSTITHRAHRHHPVYESHAGWRTRDG